MESEKVGNARSNVTRYRAQKESVSGVARWLIGYHEWCRAPV